MQKKNVKIDRISKEEKVLVSIIVPIYHVEQYIDICIASIINQSYENIEVILVDDGSDDSCPSICERYAETDGRIHVIHKKNGGLVSARKAGLAISSGDYVTFVDADDWIDVGYIKQMVENISNSDIVLAGYTEFHNENEIKECRNLIDNGIYSNKMIREEVAPKLFSETNLTTEIIPAVWNKLFRKSILENSLMKVENNVTLGEDMICSYLAVLNSDRVVINNDIDGYNYRVNDMSMTGKSDENFLLHVDALFKCIDNTLIDGPLKLEQINCYKIYIILIIGIENIVKKCANRIQLFCELMKYNRKIVKNYDLYRTIVICLETYNECQWVKNTLRCLANKNILCAVFSETFLRHYTNKTK